MRLGRLFPQLRRRIVFGVDADAHEPDAIPIGPALGTPLKFGQPGGLLRTGGRAFREHEIHDRDMVSQLVAAERGAGFVGQLELRRVKQRCWKREVTRVCQCPNRHPLRLSSRADPWPTLQPLSHRFPSRRLSQVGSAGGVRIASQPPGTEQQHAQKPEDMTCRAGRRASPNLQIYAQPAGLAAPPLRKGGQGGSGHDVMSLSS